MSLGTFGLCFSVHVNEESWIFCSFFFTGEAREIVLSRATFVAEELPIQSTNLIV